ncbi:MAG: hypothetical protein R2932_46515 [Caldilineaceae bacterium]
MADLNAALDFSPTNSSILMERIDLLLEIGEPDEVIAAFTDLIDALEADEEVWKRNTFDLFIAYKERGARYEAQGQEENAIDDYTTALALGTDFQFLYSIRLLYEQRADIYETTGRYAEAIADYSHLAAQEDSSTIDYHFAMVRLYAKLDDIDSAEPF